MHTDPQTTADWRLVLAVAHACLALDAARQYGVVVGGPTIDVRRCEELIAGGLAIGLRVTKDEIDTATDTLLAELAVTTPTKGGT
jgi:hypothetical protein